jgi:hypothetical protein
MKKLLFGPLVVLSLGSAAHSQAASVPEFRFSRPPAVGRDAGLLKSLVLSAESVSIDNAHVQSYASGSPAARTRADAFGQIVTAELRAPFGLTTGKLFVRPFASAGGGLGTSEIVDGQGAHGSDGLIWTTTVGLYVRTGPQVVWQLSYRHVETPDFDVERSAFGSRVSPNADVVGAELRFVLGR